MKKSKQKKPRRQQAKTDYLPDYLYRCCDKAFQIELDRSASLTTAATSLVVCICIVALVVIAVAGLLTPVFRDAHHQLVLALFCLCVFAVLVGGFCIALCTLFKLRSSAPGSPRSLAASAMQYEPGFEDPRKAAMRYARTLDPCYDSLCAQNAAMHRLVKAATICLLSAVGLAVVFSFVGAWIILF